jgi:hypothetical protein
MISKRPLRVHRATTVAEDSQALGLAPIVYDLLEVTLASRIGIKPDEVHSDPSRLVLVGASLQTNWRGPSAPLCCTSSRPLLAQSGHPDHRRECPLLGVKRT